MRKAIVLGILAAVVVPSLSRAVEPMMICRVFVSHLEPWVDSAGSVGQFTKLGVTESSEPDFWFKETLQAGGPSCSDIALSAAKRVEFPRYVYAQTILVDTSGVEHLARWVKLDARSREGKNLEGDRRHFRPGENFPRNCVPCFVFYTGANGEPLSEEPEASYVVRDGEACREAGRRALAKLERNGDPSAEGVAVVWGKFLGRGTERYFRAGSS